MKISSLESLFFQLSRISVILVCTTLLALLVIHVVVLLNTPIGFDVSYLNYIVFFLKKNNYVLYRDLIDISTPLTFLYHMFLTSILGYEGVGWRLFELAYFAAISCLIFGLLRGCGYLASTIVVLSAGVFYWGQGPFVSLQREFFLLLPLLGALYFVMRDEISLRKRFMSMGFLLAIVCAIKPNMLVFCPVFAFLIAQSRWSSEEKILIFQGLFLSGLIFTFVFMMPILWVYFTGGTSPFRAAYLIQSDYLTMSGSYSKSLWLNKIKSYIAYFHAYIIISVVLSLVLNSESRIEKKYYRLIVVFLSATLYEVVVGKYWRYHMLPFFILGLLLLGPAIHCIARENINGLFGVPLLSRFLLVFIIAAILVFTCIPSVKMVSRFSQQVFSSDHVNYQYVWPDQDIGYNSPNYPTTESINVISSRLSEKLLPGDKLQILDSQLGGSFTAALTARAAPATAFMTDHIAYYKPVRPMVECYRRYFVALLRSNPPRFILYADTNLRDNRLKKYPQMKAFIEQYYQVDLKHKHFTLYEISADKVSSVLAPAPPEIDDPLMLKCARTGSWL